MIKNIIEKINIISQQIKGLSLEKAKLEQELLEKQEELFENSASDEIKIDGCKIVKVIKNDQKIERKKIKFDNPTTFNILSKFANKGQVKVTAEKAFLKECQQANLTIPVVDNLKTVFQVSSLNDNEEKLDL